MEYFRESGSFGTVLPIHRTISQPQPAVGTTGTTKWSTQKISFFRELMKIPMTTQLHHWDAFVMSPSGGTSSPTSGDSNKRGRLSDEYARRLMRLERNAKFELDRAIKNQQAAVDLMPAADSRKLECLEELVKLLIRRFQRTGGFADLDGAIKNQQAAVDLTPAGDSRKLECLKELVKMLIRGFERTERLTDLDGAIKNQQAVVDLMPAGDSGKLECLEELVKLLIRGFERTERLTDLDGAIKNQQAVVDLTPAGDTDKPERLSVLAGLLMCRFERNGEFGDLERAIKNQQAAVDLTPAGDFVKPERLNELVKLLKRRLQTVGDLNSEIYVSRGASVTMPTRDMLLEDLQQLSKCIKRPKHREHLATICRMENAILYLKSQDGDELCQDIFKASTRLGAYCQALRNRAGDGTNQEELENLYKEFVRIERKFSAAHDHISSKYEQLYKQWKAERQSISKFLSEMDPNKSQGDNQEVRTLVEKVDAGFETMGTMLKNQANDLKNLSETLSRLPRHPMLVHLSPDLPVGSGDPAQVPPQPPGSLSTPSDLSKQVDDSMEALSWLNALVEKSRYTKARMIISEKSSKTTQRLKRLRTSSEYYGQESQSLSCLRTHHNDNSRDICNLQLELCSQLSSIVSGMHRMLKATVKGFSGCKASIQGLVFRPLGDLLCDLEPYLAQAGLEISNKGLHPDLILYDAAFQAIANAIPVHSKLLKDSLSVLDTLRGV